MSEIPKILNKEQRSKITLSISKESKEMLFELKRRHSTSATKLVEFMIKKLFKQETRRDHE